jgi:hypothetical protein
MGFHSKTVNSFSESNSVQANLIGTDQTGTIAVANGASGIEINGALGNVIGGSFTGDGNLIPATAIKVSPFWGEHTT